LLRHQRHDRHDDVKNRQRGVIGPGHRHRGGECAADNARTRLEALIPDEARAFCQPVTQVIWGKPYRRILDVAENEATDLIVMGVHGRNTIDLMLFGSTTNQIVRHASCPVLTLSG
jgi:nucleotide-binding universal stress UspA family protein